MNVWIDEDYTPIRLGLKGMSDITQNIQILLNTVKGTVWMDRDLGIDIRIVDTPQSQMDLKNKLVFETIERYEPRVKVKEIKHELNNLTGKVKTKVLIEIKSEYLK